MKRIALTLVFMGLAGWAHAELPARLFPAPDQFPMGAPCVSSLTAANTSLDASPYMVITTTPSMLCGIEVEGVGTSSKVELFETVTAGTQTWTRKIADLSTTALFQEDFTNPIPVNSTMTISNSGAPAGRVRIRYREWGNRR